ncbi:hypothetical protein [Bacillus aerius]|uniref:hypothetical protein n=1 Tax=Bacillus aerius TaxID=293388 RepID=UPI00344FF5FB
MQVFYYDENFLYLYEDVIEDTELPQNATDIQPIGFISPKFVPQNKEWVESATEEYINSLRPIAVPNDLALLKLQNAALTKQLTQTFKDMSLAKIREAQMAKQLAQLTTDIAFLKGGSADVSDTE